MTLDQVDCSGGTQKLDLSVDLTGRRFFNSCGGPNITATSGTLQNLFTFRGPGDGTGCCIRQHIVIQNAKFVDANGGQYQVKYNGKTFAEGNLLDTEATCPDVLYGAPILPVAIKNSALVTIIGKGQLDNTQVKLSTTCNGSFRGSTQAFTPLADCDPADVHLETVCK